MKFKSTPIIVSVFSEGDNPIDGESATYVELLDNGHGPYIKLSQLSEKMGEVIVDIEQLKEISKVAEDMKKAYNNVSK